MCRAVRGWGDVLCLWRLCVRNACRRARGCRGHVRTCFSRYFPLLPEGVRAWFAILAEAQTERLPFDEAMERLAGIPAGEAFRDRHESVKTSLRPLR
jgi:hypothetical protein